MTGEPNEPRIPSDSTLGNCEIPISSSRSSPCPRVSVVEFLRLSFTDVWHAHSRMGAAVSHIRENGTVSTRRSSTACQKGLHDLQPRRLSRVMAKDHQVSAIAGGEPDAFSS